jgi:hypothetical protein
MPREAWSSPAALRNFSIVRKLDGRPWPAGEGVCSVWCVFERGGCGRVKVRWVGRSVGWPALARRCVDICGRGEMNDVGVCGI